MPKKVFYSSSTDGRGLISKISYEGLPKQGGKILGGAFRGPDYPKLDVDQNEVQKRGVLATAAKPERGNRA